MIKGGTCEGAVSILKEKLQNDSALEILRVRGLKSRSTAPASVLNTGAVELSM